MEYHDVADIFPMMNDEEYVALVADIRANGLLEPIWTYEGKIIDGRNRYRACQELGIEPAFREWTEQGSLVDFVVSLNLKRRHLTGSQKAVVALEIEKRLAKQNPPGRPTENGGNISTISGKNRDLAAAMAGTNSHYVTDAKRIEAQAPELLADIRSGTLTIEAAKTLASIPDRKRQIALDKIARGEAKDAKDAKRQLDRAEKVQILLNKSRPLDGLLGQFPIIYADPPWQYDANTTDPSRQIGNHYPTMPLDDLCALPVSSITTPDSILYLWATSPLLEQAMYLITAWGFAYQSCAVWVKDKIGPGYWWRQQHELLLTATKGNPPKPAETDRFPSVLHAPRGEHSKKPEEMYERIERMYPELPKIELFARTTREGWQSWGNEV